MVFSGVFHEPAIVRGVMGVVFFVMNAIFALVLLILVLVATIYALVSKNPDVRYQPMRDDRASFIKSNSEMVGSTELDALGVTARGDAKSAYNTRDLDEDDSSAGQSGRSQEYATGVPLPASGPNSQYAGSHYAPSNYESGDYEKRSQTRSPNPYQQQQPFIPPASPQRSTHSQNAYGYSGNQGGNQGGNRWQVGAGYEH